MKGLVCWYVRWMCWILYPCMALRHALRTCPLWRKFVCSAAPALDTNDNLVTLQKTGFLRLASIVPHFSMIYFLSCNVLVQPCDGQYEVIDLDAAGNLTAVLGPFSREEPRSDLPSSRRLRLTLERISKSRVIHFIWCCPRGDELGCRRYATSMHSCALSFAFPAGLNAAYMCLEIWP